MNKEKRFDHHLHDFEQDGAQLQGHVQNAVKRFRLAKTCAYRMAKSYLAMLQNHQPELIDMIQESGKKVDQWLDEWFAPMAAVGEDYRALVTAAQDGMTLKQYLKETPSIFLCRKDREKTKRAATEPPLPSEPKPEATLAERAEIWATRAKAAEGHVRSLRNELRLAQQRIVGLEATVRKMHKIMDTVKV